MTKSISEVYSFGQLPLVSADAMTSDQLVRLSQFLTGINARVLKAGDTMTGALTIQGSINTLINLVNTSAPSSAAGAGYILRTSTESLSDGHRLGYLIMGGSTTNAAAVSAYAGETWGASAKGSYITFEVMGIGSTTRSVALTIGADKSAVSSGYIAATGGYTETTTTAGAYLGVASGTRRLMLANGTAAQNWQVDNNAGAFRFFLPGNTVVELSSTKIQLNKSVQFKQGNAPTADTDTGVVWIANASGTKDGTSYVKGDLLYSDNITAVNKTLRVGLEGFTLISGATTPSFTLDASQRRVYADATSAAVTATLPTPSTCPGRVHFLEKEDASANTVTMVGTVSGVVNPSLNSQYKYIEVQSIGTGWRKIGGN